jgi:hypothetical protein
MNNHQSNIWIQSCQGESRGQARHEQDPNIEVREGRLIRRIKFMPPSHPTPHRQSMCVGIFLLQGVRGLNANKKKISGQGRLCVTCFQT